MRRVRGSRPLHLNGRRSRDDEGDEAEEEVRGKHHRDHRWNVCGEAPCSLGWRVGSEREAFLRSAARRARPKRKLLCENGLSGADNAEILKPFRTKCVLAILRCQ